MASRIFSPSFRTIATRPITSTITSRAFQASARRLNDATVAVPVRKPVGAFRGGMFGFLLGSSLAAYGTYYYILDEYRMSNEMLTEDIYALQAAVQRIHNYVTSLEEKIDTLGKKSK